MKKEMQLGLQRKLLRVPVKPLKEWIFFRLLEYGCCSQKGRYPLCQSGLADANRPFYYDVLLVYFFLPLSVTSLFTSLCPNPYTFALTSSSLIHEIII